MVFLLSIAEMRHKWPFSGHGPEDWSRVRGIMVIFPRYVQLLVRNLNQSRPALARTPKCYNTNVEILPLSDYLVPLQPELAKPQLISTTKCFWVLVNIMKIDLL